MDISIQEVVQIVSTFNLAQIIVIGSAFYMYDKFIIRKRFDAVDKRFDAVDKRFDAVDKRFDALINKLDERFDALINKLEERFDNLELKIEKTALINERVCRIEGYINRDFSKTIIDK